MIPQEKYKFHCLEIKYTYAILASFLGGIFVMLTVLVIMSVNDLDEMLLPVMAFFTAVIIGLTAYFIVKAVKAAKRPPDEIELNSSGFYSTRFGRVDFDKVKSYRITSGLSKLNTENPAPSLHIMLPQGKKIRYDLNIKYYDDEIDDYLAFIDTFVEAMAPKATESESSHTGQSSVVKDGDSNTGGIVADEQRRDYEVAKKGLKKARKRNANKFAIPVSLGIGLLALVRMCGPEIVDKFKDHPLRDMRQFTYEHYDNQVKRLQQAMLKEGKVFMFTNDSTAKARIYPNMELGSDESTNFLLHKSETADNMAYFLEHADSLGYRPVVILPEYSLKQSSRFSLPKGKNINYLFFMVYDSENQLQNIGSTNKKTLITWAVAYKKVDSLKVKINNAFPSLTRFGHIFDTVKGFNLYVTATESNGTSEAEFKQATEAVKEILLKSKVDMSKFETEIFNQPK